jgi:hypothetical protein
MSVPLLRVVVLSVTAACTVDPDTHPPSVLPDPEFVPCSEERLKPERLYDDVWATLDETYPYFDHKGIDWKALGETCRIEVCRESDDYESFVDDGMACLLAPLRDYHTLIVDPEGSVYGYGLESFDANSTPFSLGIDLDDLGIGPIGVSGTLGGGRWGYQSVQTWSTEDWDGIDPKSFASRFPDVEGWVIDLRVNYGGN